MKTIQKICIVRMGGMGDILLATPAVRALSQHFDTCDIDFIVGRGMSPALQNIPYLRSVIEFDKGGDDALMRNFLPFLAGLHQKRYDLFVNFHPSAKTFCMAFASGAHRHVTFRKNQRIQPDTRRIRHAVDDFSKELRPLGIASVPDRRLDYVVTQQEIAGITARLCDESSICSSDPVLVVNPGASHTVNRWPAVHIAGLLDMLAREMPFLRVVLCGGGGDREIADAVVEAATVARPLVLTGKTSVRELGALLQRASVLVTGDTGPMHIASALGTPVVALFGPADPDRTGPVGTRSLVVVNHDGPNGEKLTCVPCRKRTCRRGDTACMTYLQAETVASAVQSLLQESKVTV